MSNQSSLHPGPNPADDLDEQIIGTGSDAVVHYSRNAGTVRKAYLVEPPSKRSELAKREFDALMAAQNALSDVSYIRCPMPLSVNPERGELEMEFIDGERLEKAISSQRFNDRALSRQLAGSLSDAFQILAKSLPAGTLDFSLRNTLIDDQNRVILVDFTPRATPRGTPHDASGIEFAVASFLTSALTYQVRQSTMLKREVGRRLRAIAIEIICIVGEHENLNLNRVEKLAWRFYWRQSVNRGWKRYLWFHTVGMAMFWWLVRDVNRAARDFNNQVPDDRTPGEPGDRTR